mgnify:CR=1 FL=1
MNKKKLIIIIVLLIFCIIGGVCVYKEMKEQHKYPEDYRDEIFRAKIDLGDTTWTYYSVNNPA